MSLPQRADVVVIGGGIFGCVTALHLLERGVEDVLVLERDGLAQATSHAGGGFVGRWGGGYVPAWGTPELVLRPTPSTSTARWPRITASSSVTSATAACGRRRRRGVGLASSSASRPRGGGEQADALRRRGREDHGRGRPRLRRRRRRAASRRLPGAGAAGDNGDRPSRRGGRGAHPHAHTGHPGFVGAGRAHPGRGDVRGDDRGRRTSWSPPARTRSSRCALSAHGCRWCR